MKLWMGLVAVVASVFCACAASASEARYALIVVNENYEAPLTHLSNPFKDGVEIANALRQTGFEVEVIRDADRPSTLKAVRALSERLKNAKAAGADAIGFLYYSGHGGSALVDARRKNFLIPAAAPIAAAQDLIIDGVALDDVIGILNDAKAKAMFVVFDACRNELPWSKSGPGGEDPDKSFGIVPARPGLLIAYATDQGSTAPDDGAFAKALALEIKRPGQPHLIAFDRAARAVGAFRQSDRLPWYSNQISSDICFVDCTPANNLNEEQVWSAAKLSDMQVFYRLYLKAYPAGMHAGEARNYLERARLSAQPSDAEKCRRIQPLDLHVYFALESSTLIPEAGQVLDVFAENALPVLNSIGEFCGSKVIVASHEDASLPATEALALTQRRANVVRDALIARGVPSDTIVAIGKGASEPLVPTADGVREPLNRRVTISLEQ